MSGQGYEVFDFEAIQLGPWGNYTFVCRLKLKEQPRPKRQPRPERRTIPRNPAVLRQLLREVMIRNRRASDRARSGCHRDSFTDIGWASAGPSQRGRT